MLDVILGRLQLLLVIRDGSSRPGLASSVADQTLLLYIKFYWNTVNELHSFTY